LSRGASKLCAPVHLVIIILVGIIITSQKIAPFRITRPVTLGSGGGGGATFRRCGNCRGEACAGSSDGRWGGNGDGGAIPSVVIVQ
jgi:hypothetical protein